MKAVKNFALNLALLIVIACATIAAAGAGGDTCVGKNATIGATCTPLINTTSGNSANTAIGSSALLNNTAGSANTAAGYQALSNNIGGNENTAIGTQALFANSTGSFNTATGLGALFLNDTGSDNTATGYQALSNNSGGGSNTANGENALFANTAGSLNTATGIDALKGNTTGASNTVIGAFSLIDNTTGGDNSGIGADALEDNDTGNNNTAAGWAALQDNSTGSTNIGIGFEAGSNLSTGDNNIDIGNMGVAAEANTIRIGAQGTQTKTFIAGIFGGARIKKGCDVVADSSGMLGCAKSSARYKRDIHDMGNASDKLMKLRPVTFQYKQDSDGIQQYGLIAEEVEEVYPELVVDGADGRAETVEYQVLPAMLLNEVQKEHRDSEIKSAKIASLAAKIAEMKASMRRQNVAFEERLSRIEQTMASTDGGRNIAAAFRR